MKIQSDIKHQAKRTCTKETHQTEIPTHICTFDRCNLNNRWVCFRCALESIHNHGMETQEHIMEENKFLQFIQQKEQHRFEYYYELLTSIEQFIKELNKLSQIMIEFLQTEKIRIKQENNINFIEDCIEIIKNEFNILSNEQIIKLINMEQTLIQFDDQKALIFMKQQKILFQDFIVLIQKVSEGFQVQEKKPQQKLSIQQNDFVQESIYDQEIQKNETNEQLKCFNEYQQKLLELRPKKRQILSFQQRPLSQDHQYRFKPISLKGINKQLKPKVRISGFTQESFRQTPNVSQIIQKNQQLKYNLATQFKLNDKINTVFITSDGQFLILGQNNGQIKIHDLQQDEIVKIIELDKIVIICACDNESNYLVCGDSKGYLQIYGLKDNFKQIYNKKIHNGIILNIKFINQMQLITCSDDKNIIITNFIDDKQLIKIQSQHDSHIYDIDYDDNEKTIISSCNRTINFISQEISALLFNQLDAHGGVVSNIQLIPKENCLISSDLQVIKIWRIDYLNKQLQNLDIFEFKNDLSTFYQISHKSNFVFVVQKLCDYDTNNNQIQTKDENFLLQNFLNKFQITKYIIFLKSDFKQQQGLQIFKQEELSNRKQ